MDICVISASKDFIVNSYVLIIVYALAVELVMNALEYIQMARHEESSDNAFNISLTVYSSVFLHPH